MSDNLNIFGQTYTDVTGIKAKDTNNVTQTYIKPTGTLSIISNGTVNAAIYEFVNVNVPAGATVSNQDKTVSPSENEQIITADSGYTGLGTVTVKAISEEYIGSAIDVDPTITVSGKTVTIPKGYYSAQNTKDVATMTLPTSASSSATSGYISKATIGRSTADQYINIPTGYNTAGAYYKVSAVANGSAGTPTAAKGTVSNNTISITPSVTNITGYITGGTKSGTAVSVSASELVSGTLSINTNGTKDVTNYAAVNVNVPTGATINNQNKTVTPTTSTQTIEADVDSNNYTGLGAVTVNPIPSNYITTSDANATASQILLNRTAYVNGSKVTGSMPNNGATGGTITTQGGTYSIPAGYTSGGTVTASLSASTITNGVLNVATVTEATGDYGVQASITIPAGYYNTTTLSKVLSTVLPAPATAISISQMLAGYQAYNNEGQLLTGTMTNQEDWGATLDQTTTNVTIPAGYHDGTGTVSHATVTVPNPSFSFNASTGVVTASNTWTRGFTTNTSYSNTYTVSAMTLPTSAATTSSGTAKATITRSTATRYINIPVGYNNTAAHYVISAVANGSATGPSSVSGTGATVSAGSNTLTFSKTISITPVITTTGYISAGTATNATVQLTATVATKSAATITPSTTNQTISAGTYLTGAQTIAGDADLVAGNIKAGVNIFNVNGTFTSDATATASDIVSSKTAYVNGSKVTGNLVVNKYYTGTTAPAASFGNNGDIYFQNGGSL